MRKTFTLTALAALVALPLIAGPTDADASCRSRKLNGTVIGGLGGALLGGAVTHGSTGPIVGGLGGAVVGHEIGRSGCGRQNRGYAQNTRSRYAAAPAPARAVRKVYYDQYGNPVASAPVEYRR
ncbi:hypothetical protein [Phenylobacterium sp.]|uniref:hypothetical protein n=1 Tax=Phenylobacterium sp. TaxID=1871053 RepID=UPI00286E5A91|nr:hypothetical protein [Phenylobacterium sp.]